MANIGVPQVFESTTGMGEPVGVFTQSMSSKIISMLGFLACIVVALLLGYYGLVMYGETYPDAPSSNKLIIVAAAIIMMLMAVYMSWRIMTHWREAAVVYGDGFAHFNGKAVRTFKWADVESIMMKVVRHTYFGIIPAGTDRSYTVATKTDTVKLDGTLSKVDKLLEHVRDQTFPLIMSRSKAAFDQGQTVQFGPIALSQKGIQKGNKTYAWEDMARVAVSAGVVGIQSKKGNFFGGLNAPVAKIPNVDVFLGMVDDMLKKNS